MQNLLVVAVMALGVTGEVSVFNMIGTATAKFAKTTFRGHGVMLDLHGAELSRYDLELTRTKPEANVIDQTIRVQLAKGEVKTLSQHIERKEQSLHITSEQGEGFGAVLSDGFITTYQPLADGGAYAQTRPSTWTLHV